MHGAVTEAIFDRGLIVCCASKYSSKAKEQLEYESQNTRNDRNRTQQNFRTQNSANVRNIGKFTESNACK